MRALIYSKSTPFLGFKHKGIRYTLKPKPYWGLSMRVSGGSGRLFVILKGLVSSTSVAPSLRVFVSRVPLKGYYKRYYKGSIRA